MIKLRFYYKNGTWKNIKFLPNKEVLFYRLILNIKLDLYLPHTRLKVQLVAKSYKHRFDIDYSETFTYVTK